MLYAIGPLECDTFPFEVGSVERETTADFAKHALVSAPEDYEFAGRGTSSLTVSGQLLPFHIGGLSELETAHALCEGGQPQWVFRGDGRPLGWYVITKVKEKHKHISPTGIGFVIEHELNLERVDDPGSDVGGDLISTLISLFG